MTPKRIVFLNVPIITSEGAFVYRTCSPGYAAGYLEAFPDVPRLSAIGHQSTADAMTDLLGEPVALNRVDYKAEGGDVAIVMKLDGRLPEGVALDREALDKVGFHFGLLTFSALLAFDASLAHDVAVRALRDLIAAHAMAYMGELGDPEGHLQPVGLAGRGAS